MINSIASLQNGEIDKKQMIKTVVGITVGVAVDMTVTALIGHHLPVGKGWRKAMWMIGSFMIGIKAGEDAENYFYKVYDETLQTLKEAKTEVEQAVANDIQKETPAEGTVE